MFVNKLNLSLVGNFLCLKAKINALICEHLNLLLFKKSLQFSIVLNEKIILNFMLHLISWITAQILLASTKDYAMIWV